MKGIMSQIDLSRRNSKIIAIEGFDAVGKHTQATAIKTYFENKGLKVGMISLPEYTEPSADLINRWLNRQYNLDNAYVIASLYAINRFNAIYYNANVLDSIVNGDVFIFDRYCGSNILHTMSLVPDNEKMDLCSFVTCYEHNLLRIPKPDITIFLDLDPDTAHRLCVERAKKSGVAMDENEDLEFQKNCYRNKQVLSTVYDTDIVDCNVYDGNRHAIGVLPIGDITNKIISVLNKYNL